MYQSPRVALVVLVLLFAASIGQTYLTADQWPEKVASHFNFAGQVDGWMSRNGHLMFWCILSMLLPIFMVSVFYAVRHLPSSLVNMPHREYWLSPERRAATAETMLSMGAWFSSWMMAFFMALYHLLLSANRTEPPVLNGKLFGLLLVVFLAGVAVWVVLLNRTFRVHVGPTGQLRP